MATMLTGKWPDIARELEVLTKAVNAARLELKRAPPPQAAKPLLDLGPDLRLLPPGPGKSFHKPVTFTLAYGRRRFQAVVERDSVARLLKGLPQPVDPARLSAEDLLQVIEFAAIGALQAAERAVKQPVAVVSMLPGDTTGAGRTAMARLDMSGVDYGLVKLVAPPVLN